MGIDFDKMIEDLKLFKAMIEWDFPITYQIKIDEIIEIIQEVRYEI